VYISGVRSSALACILPITQNRSGWQELSQTGVPSLFYLIPLLPLADIVPSRCDARPTNLELDSPGSHRRLQEKTDFLIDPGILWDEFGVRHDIVVISSLKRE
jgi:hypothetical protein